LRPETAVSRRGCAVPGSLGEQHARPGSTARASRRLRPETAVSRRGCAVPGSLGEQHARPGSTARASRRLRLETAVSRRGRAVPGSTGEQHATPGQAVAPASRPLPGEAGVCGSKPPCPAGAVQSHWSAGEQNATAAATARDTRRLPERESACFARAIHCPGRLESPGRAQQRTAVDESFPAVPEPSRSAQGFAGSISDSQRSRSSRSARRVPYSPPIYV